VSVTSAKENQKICEVLIVQKTHLHESKTAGNVKCAHRLYFENH